MRHKLGMLLATNADFERIVGPVAAKQPVRTGDGG
jgi:hypothetical protein